MRLAPPPLLIEEKEGFSKRDTFRVKEAADRLADLVNGLEGHSVILLDGDWGSGKSTFAKQWAGLLRTRKHPVVEFDAFEADYHDNAFAAMFAALLDGLGDAPDGPSSRPVWVQSMRKAFVDLARATPSILAGVAAGSPFGPVATTLFEATKHMVEQSGQRPDNGFDEYLEQQLDRIRGETRAVSEFRGKLAEAVTAMTASGDGIAPLVFIIDELDRCKPSFALNVLERMKHVFSADGVCFVLVTHLSELTNMVRHAYGLERPELYLDKFHHLKVDVDQLLSSGGTDVSSEYISYLCEKMGLGKPDKDYDWFATLVNLARLHELSLRSLERVILNLSLYARTQRNYDIKKLMPIAAGLCVMRVVEPALYRSALAGQLMTKDAMEFLKLDEWDIGVGNALEHFWKQVTWSDVRSLEENQAGLQGAPASVMQKGAGGLVTVRLSHVVGRVCEDIDLFAQHGNG